MRGWLGEGPYPVESAPVDNQAEVDVYVSNQIYIFEDRCQKLGTIGDHILKLPLLRYRRGHGQYVRATSFYDGFTIQDRINIVKHGDILDNPASCIRLSSNWLLSSAYRYLYVLGHRLDFSMDRAADIS